LREFTIQSASRCPAKTATAFAAGAALSEGTASPQDADHSGVTSAARSGVAGARVKS
jgi:hypothetical protein